MSNSKRTVLIVEDEFVLYEELTEYFEEKGYSIIGNADGSAVDNYDDAVKLLQTSEPDIAVLDIHIKGKRDGLELASYIKDHFYTLIIILTAYDNHENLERARLISPDGFVLKADKPLNKKQLWATIMLTLPKVENRRKRKTQGEFLRVRQVDIRKLAVKSNGEKKENEPVDIETFIRWDNITHIVSLNAKSGEGNNNVLIYTIPGDNGYIYRSPLNEMAKLLPINFVRFDQSTIVNLHHISARGRGSGVYYINDTPFRLTDRYKEEAADQISLVLGDKF